MGISINEVDIDKDLEIMADILNETRELQTDIRRFEWLYKENPAGTARAWLAVNDKNGDVAGFTSVIPRKMLVSGEEMMCWNCSDFSIRKKYRTLGIAVKLRKSAKECVNNNVIPFLYAHPNDRMKVIHMKAGHFEIGKMIRFAKMLKVDKKIEKRVGTSFFSRWLSATGNLLLDLTEKKHKGLSHVEFEIHKGDEFRFDEEFDRFFKAVVDSRTIFGIRESSYLNWRYIENPVCMHEVAIIRNRGKLAGYIIYFVEDEITFIKDILCVEDEEIKSFLVSSLIQNHKDRNINSMSVTFLETNKWIRIFREFGFMSRESSSVIVYPNPENKFADYLLDADNWYMTVGDRDV